MGKGYISLMSSYYQHNQQKTATPSISIWDQQSNKSVSLESVHLCFPPPHQVLPTKTLEFRSQSSSLVSYISSRGGCSSSNIAVEGDKLQALAAAGKSLMGGQETLMCSGPLCHHQSPIGKEQFRSLESSRISCGRYKEKQESDRPLVWWCLLCPNCPTNLRPLRPHLSQL